MIAANGLRLETAVAGEGGARFALLLHGFPESSFSWRFQIPMLAGLGYEVWAPNLRGYSASSRPQGVEAYRVRHLVADVAGLVDAGAKGRPVTLIAHDWGALIAWNFAMQAARPLERLVILNVPHPTVFREMLPSREQLARSWYAFAFQLPLLPEWALGRNRAEAVGRAFHDMAIDKTNFGEDVLAHYRNNALRPGALTAMVNYYRAAFRFQREVAPPRASAPLIQTPTLMIWGEEDSALSPSLTEPALYRGLVADFTLRRLPGVSHWVQQEAPAQVNALLASWLPAQAR
jgi:pimeloyl-ACP methyl ester carboxylesterase